MPLYSIIFVWKFCTPFNMYYICIYSFVMDNIMKCTLELSYLNYLKSLTSQSVLNFPQ